MFLNKSVTVFTLTSGLLFIMLSFPSYAKWTSPSVNTKLYANDVVNIGDTGRFWGYSTGCIAIQPGPHGVELHAYVVCDKAKKNAKSTPAVSGGTVTLPGNKTTVFFPFSLNLSHGCSGRILIRVSPADTSTPKGAALATIKSIGYSGGCPGKVQAGLNMQWGTQDLTAKCSCGSAIGLASTKSKQATSSR